MRFRKKGLVQITRARTTEAVESLLFLGDVDFFFSMLRKVISKVISLIRQATSFKRRIEVRRAWQHNPRSTKPAVCFRKLPIKI